MENMERSLSERMNEKFSEFDKRITSNECSVVGGAGHVGPGSSLGGWGSHSNMLESSDSRIQKRAKRKGIEIPRHKSDK